MPPCNLEFIRRGVSRKTDDFHTVQQRLRNRIQRIGRTDEEHVGQVIGHVHIMVGESTVLLRIQYFQKRRRRIAVIRFAQLVHLIQNHDRIGNTAFGNAVHNPAGHCADVGTAMPADISLIPYSAEADPHVFSVKCPGDALSDAGLACAGSADETKNRSGLFLLQIHNRNLLNDTVLDPLHAEVILVQNLLRLADAYRLRRLLFPGQAGDKIEIIIQHSGFRAVLIFLFQTVQHLFRLPAGVRVHTGFLDFQFKSSRIADILRMHLIQLFLQIIHLLPDGVLPICLAVVLLLFVLRLSRQPGDFDIFIHPLFNQVVSGRLAVRRQNRIFILRRIAHPLRHTCGDLVQIPPLHDVIAGNGPPLEAGGVGDQCRLQFFQPLAFILRIRIADIRPRRNVQLNSLFLADPHRIHVHPRRGLHNKISVGVYFLYDAGNADGIEAVRSQFLPALFSFLHQEDDMLSLLRTPARQLCKPVGLKEDARLRYDNNVIYRYYKHPNYLHLFNL